MRQFAYGCSVTLATAVVCLAQSTQPVQTSGTADSPKSAIKSLVKAMSMGDVTAMHDLLYADNPTEQRLVTAMTDTAVAIADLNRAMASKFGEEQTRAVLGDPADAVRMTNENLDKAQEQINGDAAKVSMSQAAQGTMSLKKINGKWKVDVAAYINGATPEQVNQTLSGVEHGISVYKESLADVNSGKYKTAKEAGEALRAKISPPPTTAANSR